MPLARRQILQLLALAVFACSLTACGTINEKMSSAMGDYVPQWAGGLPPDAPPRPGTPAYDAYMKAREQARLAPAADRAAQSAQAAEPGQQAQSSPLAPVH